MSQAGGDARLSEISREDIARLALSYDRFVHALDPFSEDTAAAEREFKRDLADCFDVACIRNPELAARISRISAGDNQTMQKTPQGDG